MTPIENEILANLVNIGENIKKREQKLISMINHLEESKSNFEEAVLRALKNLNNLLND